MVQNKNTITLINPNLILQSDDIFTTGVVYMPIMLATFAGVLLEKGYNCKAIDAFGESPNQWWKVDNFIIRGLTSKEVIDRIDSSSDAIFLYAINITYHKSIIELLQAIKMKFKEIPIVIMENSQAVTAYSLKRVMDEFFSNGADFIITGDPEKKGLELIEKIRNRNNKNVNIEGVGYKINDKIKYLEEKSKKTDLNSFPFPAWELFPLKNYWKIRYAHGPLSSKKYLPILTSRGCPYQCKFCVVPDTNDKKWRSRSAVNIIDEIEYSINKYQVNEFHIEDLNPTVDDKRTRAICKEIIKRNLKIKIKICSGTKVETIKDRNTIILMAKAGFKYISISPESGSPSIMKSINKPFNYIHAIELIKEMNRVGIKSQACFVLGFPGETDDDRELTRKMILDITKSGADEIALFIITPVPGSNLFNHLNGYADYSQLNFSPTWRDDYSTLNKYRLKQYRTFLLYKLRYHPIKLLRQCFNFVFKNFETKMEMIPYRALIVMLMRLGVIGKEIQK